MTTSVVENGGPSTSPIAGLMTRSPPIDPPMQKFRLYETQSKFYMIGRNKGRTYWRVLKIDKLDPSELYVREDSTTYTESECSDLLRRINEGNKATGGLKFVTICYGIVGFIKFLGPYYMLLITKRRRIGVICGHNVYAVSKSKMIPIQNSSLQADIVDSKNENRHHLQSTLWTVALVYGFFKQETLSVAGRDYKLTLIARRSRHYAGTRYLKRGVNDKGRVANDVETEQIVFEDVPKGLPVQISSVVQNRGSIPLFWSQETSRLNIKPDIMLSRKDQNYEATRLHFQNLSKRYGNPIIILNLIKTREKRPRESILRTEFANAISCINNDLPEENRLRFLHWDLHKHSRRATNALLLLGKVAAYALTLTGFFYCQVMPVPCRSAENGNMSSLKHLNNGCKDVNNLGIKTRGFASDPNENHSCKKPMFQKGVLRTNCIDCLDRTNVAQFSYGLAALGCQCHALGVLDSSKIDLDAPLTHQLMGFYENMGDTLAHQYGGSAAHNKIFSERRGQWKAATQSQEFFRTLQRYYSNAYMDAQKQDAINVFLGHFQPQYGKPALWELDSDQYLNVGTNAQDHDTRLFRSFFKRSFSDGNILHHSCCPVSAPNLIRHNVSKTALPEQWQGATNIYSESSPTTSTCNSSIAFSRNNPPLPQRQLFGDIQRDQIHESDHVYFSEDTLNWSNFVDLDWLSSSGNSFEDEPFDRTSVITSPSITGQSTESVTNGMTREATPTASEYGSMRMEAETEAESSSLASSSQRPAVLGEYSDSFVQWVNNGETLCY
ncbi:Phosphoinositide phosphatase SAC4 [Linum perenne]